MSMPLLVFTSIAPLLIRSRVQSTSFTLSMITDEACH